MISIIRDPFWIDFSGNDLYFKFRAQTIINSGGKYIRKIRILKMPTLENDWIKVGCYNSYYTFTVVSNLKLARGNAFWIPKALSGGVDADRNKTILDEYFVENYYLRQHFDIVTGIDEVVENNTTVRYAYMMFTALCSEFAELNTLTLESNNSLSFVSLIEQRGVDPTILKNHKACLKIAIEKYESGILKHLETSEFYLDFVNSEILFSLEILRSYFTQVDIPDPKETGITNLLYAHIKYKIIYAEAYGDDGIVVQRLKTTSEYIALSGKIKQNRQNINSPDWLIDSDCILPSFLITESRTGRLFNYGCDNFKTIKTFKSMPQYVYFDSICSAVNHTFNVSVDLIYKDGTRLTNHSLNTYTTTANNIIRLAIGYEALNLENLIQNDNDIIQYTVKIQGNTLDGWQRTFFLVEKPYFGRVLMLQNRLGVLETFYVESFIYEQEVNGNIVSKNSEKYMDITDENMVITINTGYKTATEMQLLSESFASNYNYLIEDKKAFRILIVPETFKTNDETEDLQSVSFKVKYAGETISIENHNTANRDADIASFKDGHLTTEHRLRNYQPLAQAKQNNQIVLQLLQ